MDFIIFAVSMAALIFGAGKVVEQSEKIALHYGISQFVIGASLVAFGTSLPEMAASISASLKGSSDIAISNVVGSNIFNIALILGTVFVISKTIRPDRDLFFKDSYWAIVPVIVFILMIIDGTIGRFDAVLLLLLMAAYLYFLIKDSKDLMPEIEGEEKERFNWTKSLAFLAIGFIFTIGGADFAIESATNIARSFQISEWIIGMFLVSIGTSLPELVVSLVAAKEGKADMSIGNIIGSNVANVTMVLGSAALIAPLHLDLAKNVFDVSALLGITLMLVFITANKLYNRAAGLSLLVVLAIVVQNALSTL